MKALQSVSRFWPTETARLFVKKIFRWRLNAEGRSQGAKKSGEGAIAE
jgi:hypothetical protein